MKSNYRILVIYRFFGFSGVVLYGMLAPWYLPEFTGFRYDEARYLELIFLTSLGLLLIGVSSWRHYALHLFDWMPISVKRAVGFLLVLALTSSLFAVSPAKALQEISLFVLLLAFGSLCAMLAHQSTQLINRLFVASIAFGAVIFVVHFITSFLAAVSIGATFSWFSPFVSFGHVRFFSQYQAYTLPILSLPLIVFNLPLRWRIIAMLLLVCFWALHFLSGSRSVWVAIIVTTLFLLVFMRQRSSQWLKWQLFGLLLGGIVFWVFDNLPVDNSQFGLGSIAKRGIDDSGRLHLWQIAFDMIKDYPLLGVGPMHYAFTNFLIAAHPHNAVLQIAAEYGIPAALIACYLAFFLLRKAVIWCKTSTNNENQQINIALAASLVCGLTDSLFSGNIIMPQSQMLLFMMGGWLVGVNLKLALLDSRFEQSVSHWQHWVLSITVLAAITINIIDLNRYYTFTQDPAFSMPSNPHPRFWTNGHWPAENQDKGGRQK